MAWARYRSKMMDEERLWQTYMAEALRALGVGQGISKRYVELIGGRAEDYDPQKVADDVIERAGLVIL